MLPHITDINKYSKASYRIMDRDVSVSSDACAAIALQIRGTFTVGAHALIPQHVDRYTNNEF